MNCEEAKELIPSYSIGALDKEEAGKLEEHIANCPECSALYLEFVEVAGHIPFALQDTAPSPELKERLFARIDQLEETPTEAVLPLRIAYTPPSADYATPVPSRLPWGFTAVGIAAVMILAVWIGTLHTRLAQLEDRYNIVSSSLEQQSEMLEGMTGTATLVKGLEGTNMAPEAKGMMFLSPSNTDALLVIFGLPPVTGDKTYQLWLITDSTRVSGGTFTTNERGYAMTAVEAPMPLKNFQSVGVTTEPKGGSTWPSGERVMAANLR